MHRLILRSELKSILPYDEILAICSSSARVNQDNNVTGFMIECGGVFLYSLEGLPAGLKPVIGRVKRDKRHHNKTTIFQNKSAPARLFGSWSMNLMFLDDTSLWQRAIGSLGAYDGFYEKSYDAAFAIGVLILSYRHACEASKMNPAPSEDQCGQLPRTNQILGSWTSD